MLSPVRISCATCRQASLPAQTQTGLLSEQHRTCLCRAAADGSPGQLAVGLKAAPGLCKTAAMGGALAALVDLSAANVRRFHTSVQASTE